MTMMRDKRETKKVGFLFLRRCSLILHRDRVFLRTLIDDQSRNSRDLSQAQSIDFDPEIADILKELTKKRIEKEKEEAKERIQKEEALRKKAEGIKRAREEAKREEAEAAARDAGMGGMPGGMPGMGGMPGGMGGMPGGMGGG